MNPMYWSVQDDRILCSLCPHRCRIPNEKSGRCGVRFNRNNSLELPYWGRLSALRADPIEKKPLYHFLPGTPTYSLGFVGCNLKCFFCQNWSISQIIPSHLTYKTPQSIIQETLEERCPSIAFTYSEPSIHWEYLMETSSLALNRGVKTVLVSNGFLNKEPAEKLLGQISAANIDLKSFTEEFYKKHTKSSLKNVLEFIESAAELTHLEVTTLIIPGLNDSEKEIRQLSAFIAGLNKNIPLHLSAYYPAYKSTIPPTSYDQVIRLREIALENLHFVYCGNLGIENDTTCPTCDHPLIQRQGYRISTRGIQGGHCAKCNSILPFLTLK